MEHEMALELDPGVIQGFSSASWPSPPPWGGGRFPVAGPEVMKVRPEMLPFPLRVYSCLSHNQHPCLKRKQCWSKRSWNECLVWVSIQTVVVLRPLESGQPPVCCLLEWQQWLLPPIQMLCQVFIPLLLYTSLGLGSPYPSVALCHRASKLDWALNLGRAHTEVATGNHAEFR